ncbi:hypothetical protein [Helicobacter sp.]|uniref:tetratricopeptide repeat protein n=1 Tax=Helicobacter sp. TaxID=218 RepID=UPI0025C68EFB|nr:hypothetical protein [Helicobacter sp.]MCI5969466.1 hypothetical protein [Helicobacter sp.]
MLDKAQMCYFNGDYQTSFNVCVQALQDLDKQEINKLESKNKLIELAALSALKLGISEALEFCAQSYNYHQDSVFYALNLAKALFLAKNYQEATRLLEALINAQHSLQLECLQLLLEVYKAQNLLENAESVYRVLLQNTPKDWQKWLECGDMYFDAAPKKALEIYGACHKIAKETLSELQSNAPFVEIPQTFEPNSLTERLNALKTPKQVKENPEITHLKAFLHTTLEVRIAQSFLQIFENPMQEAQRALEILLPLQEQNANNGRFWIFFARALEYTGYYAQAEQAYKKVFAIPNIPERSLHMAKFWLAYLLMRQNRFSEALESYEYRLHFAGSATFSILHYNLVTEAFYKDSNAFKDKEIFVYCEQGFGDTLMFCRTLEALCAVAKRVYFAPQSALYSLFKTRLSQEDCFKNLEILDTIPTHFDFALPLTSLPYFLGLDSLEKMINLKTPLAIRKKKSKNIVKRIGFFWHTNFALKEDNTRNFSLEFFLNFLLELKNVELVSLQVGEFELPKNVENVGRDFKGWLDTYKAMEGLDCVVGIDSSPAHLALLCGIPTLIILQPRFDWRFGLYEAPKAKFYGENAHLFVSNPNDLNSKKGILEKMQQILEL